MLQSQIPLSSSISWNISNTVTAWNSWIWLLLQGLSKLTVQYPLKIELSSIYLFVGHHLDFRHWFNSPLLSPQWQMCHSWRDLLGCSYCPAAQPSLMYEVGQRYSRIRHCCLVYLAGICQVFSSSGTGAIWSWQMYFSVDETCAGENKLRWETECQMMNVESELEMDESVNLNRTAMTTKDNHTIHLNTG